MQLTPSTHSHPPFFRFDTLWLEQEELCSLIVKWWTEFQQRVPDIAKYWSKKIGFLRQKIRGWAKNFYAQKRKKVPF